MRIAIFGAGQAGQMISNWIRPDDEFVGYIDNDEKKWGKSINRVGVSSLEDTIQKFLPDTIWLAIINKEAKEAVREQIFSAGYTGRLIELDEIRNVMDVRVAALRLAANEINEKHIPGAVAELGVYKGDFSSEINRLFPDRKIYLFDTFEGFCPEDIEIEKKQVGSIGRTRNFSDTSIESVREKLPHPDKAVFVRGRFPESMEKLELPEFAFVSLDPDLYEPILKGLEIFYPRLSVGGMIFIHDYNSCQFKGVRMAVDKYCNENNLFVVPLMDVHGSAVLIKQGK